MKNDGSRKINTGADIFGLRKVNFNIRVPEASEMFSPEDARDYINGCDYPKSVDELLLVWEMQRFFGQDRIKDMRILEAMCGPGRLAREFSGIGVKSVVSHDGDSTMLEHARSQALPGMTDFIQSPVDNIPNPNNSFDLVICHNSIHQLSSIEKLHKVMTELLRLAVPGGWVIIADYQRSIAPEFLEAIEERLKWTKPEIVPLLVSTYIAAFSKEEFKNIVGQLPGIKKWVVQDALPPVLTPDKKERVDQDPVKHLLDFSAMSLRVIIQK